MQFGNIEKTWRGREKNVLVALKRGHCTNRALHSCSFQLTVKYTTRINIEGVKVQKYIPHQANMIQYSADTKSDDSQATSTSESLNYSPHWPLNTSEHSPLNHHKPTNSVHSPLNHSKLTNSVQEIRPKLFLCPKSNQRDIMCGHKSSVKVGQAQKQAEYLDPEDGSDMLSRKLGWFSIDYTALHPRTKNFS